MGVDHESVHGAIAHKNVIARIPNRSFEFSDMKARVGFIATFYGYIVRIAASEKGKRWQQQISEMLQKEYKESYTSGTAETYDRVNAKGNSVCTWSTGSSSRPTQKDGRQFS